MTRPFLVGVAGGSGSGKSTVADRLAERGGPGGVVVLRLDAYYRDRGDLPIEQRAALDYDHPDAFDWELLRAHAAALREGQPVDVPAYDFATHARTGEQVAVAPARIVVVEGILVLHDAVLRERLDLRVFVDTDADVCLARRLQRDVAERGRTPESVREQFEATVRPAHVRYVEPTKAHADVVIRDGGFDDAAIDGLLARLPAR
jgi:uridine kinase